MPCAGLCRGPAYSSTPECHRICPWYRCSARSWVAGFSGLARPARTICRRPFSLCGISGLDRHSAARAIFPQVLPIREASVPQERPCQIEPATTTAGHSEEVGGIPPNPLLLPLPKANRYSPSIRLFQDINCVVRLTPPKIAAYLDRQFCAPPPETTRASGPPSAWIYHLRQL